MAIVLVILALGSVVAGYVGVPAALGANNWIEHYLHPSFVAHGVGGEHRVMDRSAAHAAMQSRTAAGEHATAPDAAGTEAPAEGASDGGEGGNVALERTLMLVSSIIAILGIGLAWYFFVSRPSAADSVAASAAPLHRLFLHKYYVDELYDAGIVQPIKRLSTGFLWKGVDAGIIDGTVNGTGAFVSAASSVLRRLQTGSVRAYAVSVFLGVVTELGYYIWRF